MILSSYLVQPKKIHFETQAKEEKIILLLRSHPVTQLPWIIFVIFAAILPVLLLPVALETGILPAFVTFNMIIFFLLMTYLIIFGYSFMRFLLWYFNVNIVTDQRIVDIDFPYLLYKESTATRIEQVEDITHRRGGFARTAFDFGDVYVQTAGTQANIEFLDIPRPGDVVKQIVELWQIKKPEKARTYVTAHRGGK